MTLSLLGALFCTELVLKHYQQTKDIQGNARTPSANPMHTYALTVKVSDDYEFDKHSISILLNPKGKGPYKSLYDAVIN